VDDIHDHLSITSSVCGILHFMNVKSEFLRPRLNVLQVVSKRKVNVDLYSASTQTPLTNSDMDHTVLPANRDECSTITCNLLTL